MMRNRRLKPSLAGTQMMLNALRDRGKRIVSGKKTNDSTTEDIDGRRETLASGITRRSKRLSSQTRKDGKKNNDSKKRISEASHALCSGMSKKSFKQTKFRGKQNKISKPQINEPKIKEEKGNDTDMLSIREFCAALLQDIPENETSV